MHRSEVLLGVANETSKPLPRTGLSTSYEPYVENAKLTTSVSGANNCGVVVLVRGCDPAITVVTQILVCDNPTTNRSNLPGRELGIVVCLIVGPTNRRRTDVAVRLYL